jgi:hypothetical protein
VSHRYPLILIMSSSPFERMHARTALAFSGWRIEDVSTAEEADRAYSRNGGMVILVIDGDLLDGHDWQALRATNPMLRTVARSPIPADSGVRRIDSVTLRVNPYDHEGLHEAICLLS